jgi:hypothetical protein
MFGVSLKIGNKKIFEAKVDFHNESEPSHHSEENVVVVDN